MPRKSRRSPSSAAKTSIQIPSELLDQVVKGPMSGEEVNDLCLSLKKAIIERAMGAEMSHHLGYRPGEPRPAGQGNHRNGTTVTEEIMSEVAAWQARPLEPMYPVVFFDALRVKIRQDAVVRSQAVYLALGVLPDGSRDVLGIWIEQSEGATFWMKVFNDLRNRGVHDILIAVTDGLAGLSDAIESVFPQTTTQTCIVHLIRNSLAYVPWKDRRAVASALRSIYSAPTAEAAEAVLDRFEASEWGRRFPTIAPGWRRAWTHVIPFFAFPPEVRRVIYTTNAIESLHMQLRKIIKTRGHFPSEQAAMKLIWLAVRNAMARKTGPPTVWKQAMTQFAIAYQDRFTNPSH